MMVALIFLLLNLLISPLKSTSRLEAEIAAPSTSAGRVARKVRDRIDFSNAIG